MQRIQALNDLVTTDRDFCAQVAELFAAPGDIADALVQRWQGLL